MEAEACPSSHMSRLLSGGKGPYHTYNLDCVILCITHTICIGLVGENGLRGYSPKHEPDHRLLENLDGQTRPQQSETGNPGMGQKKRPEDRRVCSDYHVFTQN